MNHDPRCESGWKFAELQADYGPYHFPEIALQRIWRDRGFDATRLTTLDGQRVEVVDPGRWNRLGGPDFRGALLRIGAVERSGDVEVHVHARDWRTHGHDRDPAYADVILHVVLFPVHSGTPTLTSSDREIPTAVMLDLISSDLEGYAADMALESLGLTVPVAIPIGLQAIDPAAREVAVRAAALRRWDRKVADARMRIDRLGWEDACHTAALEVLGFSRNRLAMLRLAGEWPLERWRQEHPSGSELLASQSGYWTRQGFRPANHPLVRLQQYAQWVAADPSWPDWLRESDLPQRPLVSERPWVIGPHGRALRQWLQQRLCAGAIAGRRFDTMACDAFIPLLAALDRPQLELAWLAWPAGEVPQPVAALLAGSVAPPGPNRRVTNGWVQGLWECSQVPPALAGRAGGGS